MDDEVEFKIKEGVMEMRREFGSYLELGSYLEVIRA